MQSPHVSDQPIPEYTLVIHNQFLNIFGDCKMFLDPQSLCRGRSTRSSLGHIYGIKLQVKGKTPKLSLLVIYLCHGTQQTPQNTSIGIKSSCCLIDWFFSSPSVIRPVTANDYTKTVNISVFGLYQSHRVEPE